MKKEKKEKLIPAKYRVTSWVILLFALFFLANTIGSAVYTIYIQMQGSLETAPLSSDWGIIGVVSYSWQAVFSLFFLLITAIGVWSGYIYLIAQFVLPVKQFEERSKARDSFSDFINGESGIAVFVKEGSIIESHGESESSGGGVILVDLSSAVVLSQHEDTESWDVFDNTEENDGSIPKKIDSRKDTQKNFAESKGPGLVFPNKGQKIFAVLDLRPQSRSASAVNAYTRNGIQVTGNVSVTFSLSEEPEIIPIGNVVTPNGVELHWLSVDENTLMGTIRIKEVFELDADDLPDLNSYVDKKQGRHYSPEQSASVPNARYKFYPNRVFNAAYSNARALSTGAQALWSDVPLEIAVDLFRRVLLTVPYDDLYISAGNGGKDAADAVKHSVDALRKLRDTFSRKMKLKGIVLFQFMQRADGQPFSVGEEISTSRIVKSPVVELIQHRLNTLRSVGVVVKSAGFSNLRPANAEIKQKMIDNWKARWEREVQFIEAEHALESVRIQNRNRAQIQQEMTHLLSGVFQNSHTDEALALRVFQALETATASPGANNDMSPKEIVGMLDSLHKWLLVDRKDLFSSDDGSTI
jgi:hypothetical protein